MPKTKTPQPKTDRSKAQWAALARRKLGKILKEAQLIPGVRALGPRAPWRVEIELVGNPAMTRLNKAFRGKAYPTDVLSFPTLKVFRDQGLLGELVIALPVLKKQARELGHSAEKELQVLLVHGVLHLLGLDHEKGPKEAAQMARWEARLLSRQPKSAGSTGLIERTR